MEFAENWDMVSTLGEGAYGEVKLLLNRNTGEFVAMKTIDLEKHSSAREDVKKEIFIHKRLSHENIIRFYGERSYGNHHLIFLEYATGGVLFDRIEPDVGMPPYEAQLFMRQLLNGMKYLHLHGIAHRDIKPENLLISINDVLKISDFGLATYFRLKNRERMLATRCGTLPYIAPEVLKGSYAAIPADLWSCGIVFVAMLSGELPWNEPSDDCREFMLWKNDSYILESPWTKLDNSSLSFAKNILSPDPKNRSYTGKILNHPWMQTNWFKKDVDDVLDGQFIQKVPEMTVSQPQPRITVPDPSHLADLLKSREQVICFSQPIANEDLIIPSEFLFSQSSQKNTGYQHLVKRLTRFFVTTNVEKTVSILCSVLDKFGYIWSTDASVVITISTLDSRKAALIFKANLIEMEEKILLDFRLSKGCGLDFKRKFFDIKKSLGDIIAKD